MTYHYSISSKKMLGQFSVWEYTLLSQNPDGLAFSWIRSNRPMRSRRALPKGVPNAAVVQHLPDQTTHPVPPGDLVQSTSPF